MPRHISINDGDTIITSGFNAVFPEKIQLGTIVEHSVAENESFYSIKMKLSEDFSSLAYVYVIENPSFQERKEVESEIIQDEQ